MRKPNFGKPRAASAMFSLSRKLPRLQAPLSAAAVSVPRPRPIVNRPAKAAAMPVASHPMHAAPTAASSVPPPLPLEGCSRCGHDEATHPVRYVCDKYPHPDPLQICGCEAETLDEICSACGHKARWHKARHRCRTTGCHCWAFTEDVPE